MLDDFSLMTFHETAVASERWLMMMERTRSDVCPPFGASNCRQCRRLSVSPRTTTIDSSCLTKELPPRPGVSSPLFPSSISWTSGLVPDLASSFPRSSRREPLFGALSSIFIPLDGARLLSKDYSPLFSDL